VLIIAFFLRERSEQVEDERVNVPAGVPEGGRGLTQFEREVIGERVRDEIAQKVFEDKVSLTPRKRGAACAARYVLKSSLRSGLDFDDVIERLAVRASERLERRWPAARHDTPPKAPLIEGRICHVLGSRNFVKRLSYPMFTMFVL
jgi:hypothetical protein